MAFAARQPAQVAGMEENANVLREGKAAAAGKAGQSLLQQGSKRRAPLGDMSNLVGPLNSRAVPGKDGAKAVPEPAKAKAAAVPASRAKEAPAAAAPAPTATANPSARQAANMPLARTRSQTQAMQRQQGGMSMSSLLQARSEAAVSTKKQALVAPPSPLPDIDSAERGNPQAASEYANDIYSYYQRIEPKYRVQPGYMQHQTDINEKMRAILIDWLVEVHLKFKLMSETLYLTVNLIDRFLEAKAVTRKNLQLVGVTAMLIAAKYEEIWAPEVRDFVYISDKAYTREQILAMEKLMLNTLHFNLTLPTSHNFLARYLKAAGQSQDKQVLTLATYLVELALVDAPMLKYSYSQTSAAALYVAMRALNKADPYPRALMRHAGYTVRDVLPCAGALVALMQKAPTHSLNAVFKKYSTPKFHEVAKVDLTHAAPIISEAAALAAENSAA